MKALIAGGGIAGLATGIALRRAGIHVEVRTDHQASLIGRIREPLGRQRAWPPGHSRGTDSRYQAALEGHGRTRWSGNLSSGGHLRSRRDL
ncbi:MAG: hypothetical protein M3082_20745 [Candidatus Dormibacteraeota bacterium]|nr:hypothetical protein [Candidatus Dormibacteraeota bacterium]